MADIINISNKEVITSTELKNPLSVELLNSFNKNPDSFSDLIVFFKKEDGTVGVLETMPSIEDKCLFAQILQHQIMSYLNYYNSPIDSKSIEDDI